jgi:antitoxin MazE
MRAKIVRIGNSQGVRIPKPLLLRSGLSGEVEIDAQDDQIVIRAARRPREDWDAAFVRMSESGDDVLLDGDTRALPRTVLMLESCEVGTDIEHVTSP